MPVTSSPYENDFLLHADVEQQPITTTSTTPPPPNNTIETIVADDNSVYARQKEGSSSEEEIDLGDGDESIYLVKKRGTDDELFVVITENRIYERDITSKIKSHWHIESLINCELVEEEGESEGACIRLCFETLRKDKKLREYVLEWKEAGRLTTVLKNILENKPPEDSVPVYQCMKCSQQFSVDDALEVRKKPLQCPACESTLVIEHED